MSTLPRLFAHTRQQHKNKQLSSENFIIALFDIYTDDIRLRQELRRLPNCHYFRARNIDDCFHLITQDDAKNTLVILIISNRFQDFIGHISLEIAPQLSFIYLFDTVLCNLEFPSDRRFRGTFDHVESLFTKIKYDISDIRDPQPLANPIALISEDNAEFFWYRFFFNVLDRLQHTDIAKREILSRLRDYQHEKRFGLDHINEFEREYQLDHVIWWYTRHYFFFHLLNKALRENDINEIFLWRTYIQDLDRELRQLRLEQRDFRKIYLYRGQVLPTDDLNKLRGNVDKLMTATSFLSTSADECVVTIFAITSHSDSMMSPVMFRINVDSNDTKAIFADIHSISVYSDEQEFLFSLRSLFRIDRIKFENELWYIDLTAVDEDDQQFCQAINPWKAKISEQSFFSGRPEPLFTRYLTIENSSFLAFQLLIDLMLRLNQTSYAREEMIEMCRLKYSDSPTDLNKIDQFEQSYSHQDAAKWYTTDSFLYRLLNSSLRLEDIDTICKLRYYIYDLHNQLAQLQTSYIKSLPTNESILTLYRGQRMSIEDLNKLRDNVGQLISKNSFLSTTNRVLAANLFAGDGSLDNPEEEVSVVYDITVDTSVPHSVPFAKIQYESIFQDEDEVLFSMAAVFRIDNVEQYGNLWIVDLTLINKEDETWNELTAHLNR